MSSALLLAEIAFRELGLRQKRQQPIGVALGTYCRSLELDGVPHDVAGEFYRYARERIGQ